VTLIVTPHEAEVLQLASTNARMTLVLRGPGDQPMKVDSGAGVTLVDLGGDAADAAANPPVVSPVTPVTPPAHVIAIAPRTVPPTTQPVAANAQYERSS